MQAPFAVVFSLSLSFLLSSSLSLSITSFLSDDEGRQFTHWSSNTQDFVVYTFSFQSAGGSARNFPHGFQRSKRFEKKLYHNHYDHNKKKTLEDKYMGKKQRERENLPFGSNEARDKSHGPNVTTSPDLNAGSRGGEKKIIIIILATGFPFWFFFIGVSPTCRDVSSPPSRSAYTASIAYRIKLPGRKSSRSPSPPRKEEKKSLSPKKITWWGLNQTVIFTGLDCLVSYTYSTIILFPSAAQQQQHETAAFGGEIPAPADDPPGSVDLRRKRKKNVLDSISPLWPKWENNKRFGRFVCTPISSSKTGE